MIGLFAGSFDPITIGHMDIIRRAASQTDKLFVAVFNNDEKSYMCDLSARVRLTSLALADIENVEVIGSDGMVVDYCKSHHIDRLYRGFRNSKDYEYELEMAIYNYDNSNILTYLIPSNVDYASTSSTRARECYLSGDGMENIIPSCVIEELRRMENE